MLVITPLNTTKNFFDTLTNLYENKDQTKNRALKNKLQNLKMEKDESIASFFTKISQVRDQIISIGVMVDEDDLLQTTIYGIPSTRETFLGEVNSREVQPNFERLWHDCL